MPTTASYPLAGHKGSCNRVQTADSYGRTNGVCTCQRDEALEEAAQVCDILAAQHGSMVAWGLRKAAEEIRGLKEN